MTLVLILFPFWPFFMPGAWQSRPFSVFDYYHPFPPYESYLDSANYIAEKSIKKFFPRVGFLFMGSNKAAQLDIRW